MSIRPSYRHTRFDFFLSAGLLALTTVLLAGVASLLLDLGTDYLWRAASVFLLATVVVAWLALGTRALVGFGAANRITLLRVALLALVAAAVGELPGRSLCWTIVGVVTVALILDGFDGRVARRSGSQSAFGARFDMETDAALIMVLSVLCWQFGKAGVWILAAGAMRYCFVLAARALPWMNRPLPASRRRQTVCILQSALMLAVISPLFPVPLSEWLAAATLMMLGTSFLIDIRWLWSQHRGPHPVAATPAWHPTQEP